jgi:hypothetical protein
MKIPCITLHDLAWFGSFLSSKGAASVVWFVILAWFGLVPSPERGLLAWYGLSTQNFGGLVWFGFSVVWLLPESKEHLACPFNAISISIIYYLDA